MNQRNEKPTTVNIIFSTSLNNSNHQTLKIKKKKVSAKNSEKKQGVVFSIFLPEIFWAILLFWRLDLIEGH